MSSAELRVLSLQRGRTVQFRPRGNSMTPRIRSGQLVTVTPVLSPLELRVDDVVLCRVHGVIRLHKISAIDVASSRVQISNNHGHVNGWASYGKIYGRLVAVED